MRLSALTLIFALATAPAIAADMIPAADAGKHVGETGTVVGVLSNVHLANSGKLIQLEIGGAYPNNPLSAVIFKSDMGKFPDMTAMVGKTLAITGRIEMYREKPEIVLKDISQVQVAR